MARRNTSSELDTPIWIPSPEQTKLLIWDITPEYMRVPKTLTELAAQLGVNRNTLTAWQKLPQWLEYRNLFVFLKLKSQLPTIVNAYIADLTSNQTQSWQARRDFFRYGLPMLTQTVNDPRLLAIERATNNLLPTKSLQQVVNSLPPDHQESVVKALEDLGIIEPENPQDGATSSATPSNDLNFSQFEKHLFESGATLKAYQGNNDDLSEGDNILVQQPTNRPAARLKAKPGTGSKAARRRPARVRDLRTRP